MTKRVLIVFVIGWGTGTVIREELGSNWELAFAVVFLLGACLKEYFYD